jgi:hypothetical protein
MEFNNSKTCKKCSNNFNQFVDEIICQYAPNINNQIDIFIRYSMRNNKYKFIKILKSIMKINSYSNCQTLTIPNKNISVTQEEINDRLIDKINITSNPKKFKLYEILYTLYCPHCWEKYKLLDSDKLIKMSREYFSSANIGKLFNFIIINPSMIFTIDKSQKKSEKFVLTIKNKLIEFSKQEDIIRNDKWKGSNYYFKEIFGVPIYLDGIVSKEHYQQFHSGYIEDVIAGHPMASNGWYAESLRELEEMNVFND